MPALTTLAAAMAMLVQADTVVLLGTAERDLTNDGTLEVLRLVGRGPNIDSLDVTLTIESKGRVIYEARFVPLTRYMGYDAGRRLMSRREHREYLAGFGAWVFGDHAFMTGEQFDKWMKDSARDPLALIIEAIDMDRRYYPLVDSLLRAGHDQLGAHRDAAGRYYSSAPDTATATAVWKEIRETGSIVFKFSPGGDAVNPIAWSRRDQRFYRLLVCC